MSAGENKFVYSFAKNEGDEIQMALRKYKGRYFVDLRLWFRPEEESGLRPTKKGVFFPVEHALDFKKGTEHMLAALEALAGEIEAVG